MTDKTISAREYAEAHGWFLPNGKPNVVKAHVHLRKAWQPPPVREHPPLWDEEAVAKAERKYRDVTDWIAGKGRYGHHDSGD